MSAVSEGDLIKMTRIAVTMGDPAGVGPEVVALALVSLALNRGRTTGRAAGWPGAGSAAAGPGAGVFPEQPELVVVGSKAMLERAASLYRVSLPFVKIVDPFPLSPDQVPVGRVSPAAGEAAYAYVKEATRLALAGEVDAMATAPLNKEALAAAKVPYLDHTTALEGLTGAPEGITMFETGKLRVVFLTRHMSLRRALEEITRERLRQFLGRVSEVVRRQMGMEHPRFAVAALNPHAGEGGLFGDEEAKELGPAVADARRLGMDVVGPLPADAVFHRGARGDFDLVVSLYHDQGHVAAKTLDFDGTISVTLGLPFMRTSVDHGTAFDIAGRGLASGRSMTLAIEAAVRYAVQ